MTADKLSARERISQLRQQATQELKSIEEAISERRGRVLELCRSGFRPADEVMADIDAAIDSEKGRQALKVWVRRMARPTHKIPSREIGFPSQSFNRLPSVRDLFTRHFNGTPYADEHLLAYLLADVLRAKAKELVHEFSENALPAEADRDAEIQRLTGELEALVAERDEAANELADLWEQTPPATVKQTLQDRERERESKQNKELLDAINADASERHG